VQLSTGVYPIVGHVEFFDFFEIIETLAIH